MSTTSDENNSPLGTSDGKHPSIISGSWTERVAQIISEDCDTRLIELKPLDSGTAHGIHTLISTPLNAGFVCIWWGPERSVGSLNNLMNQRLAWLMKSMKNAILEEAEGPIVVIK